MPFFLTIDIKPILPEINQLLTIECPLLPYYGIKRSIDLWFAMSLERILMLECTSNTYPNAEEYHCFNLDRLDPQLSRYIHYPHILNVIRSNSYGTFTFFLDPRYEGVIVFDK